MVRVFYYCCDFLYTAAAAWFMLTLAGAVWKPKVEGRVRKIIWAVTVVVAAGINTANNYIISTLFSKTAFMVNILLASLASILTLCCKYKDAFCLIYVSWSILTLADFFLQTLTYTIQEVISCQGDALLTATVPRGIYLLLWVSVLMILVYIMRTQKKGIQVDITRYLKKGWLLIPLLFVCIIYFQRIYRQAGLEQLMYRWWLFLLGGMLLTLAGLAYIAVQRERERYWLLQQKTEMLEYNYRVMLEGNREKEILLHDIKKHRLAIREMAEVGQNQEIIRYLDEMEQVPQKVRNQDMVNHELLNLILNRKFQEAEGLGITIEYRFDDMCGLLLTQMEICALFINILDNAIEANQALAGGKERWIKLDCARQGQMLVIYASNPMPEGKMKFLEGIPQTTKKEKENHGIGMLSIQRVVASYDGHVQIDVKEGVFELVIYMEGFR